ncbi:hypothetical protein [Pantoea agglomerans]
MMSKSKTLLLITLCVVIYLLNPLHKNGKDTISCKSDVSYHWRKNQLDLLITQHLQDGKGILSISGILYDNDKAKAYLSKTVSFSYQQNGNFYYFRSELIMDSPQMTMSLSDQKRWLPDFFIDTNKPLLLKAMLYGNGAWIFYSENTPLFVCERSQ